MPLIPLITRNTPLPDAPAPVLDRNRRPTVDNRGVSAALGQLASVRQPQASPEAFAAPYEALGSVGRALAVGGGVLGALAIKRREAEVYNQVHESDVQMQVASSEMEAFKAKNPDPALWNEGWQKISAPVIERVLANEKLHPEAREKSQIRLDAWQRTEAARVNAQGAVMTFRQARQNLEGTIRVATETQNEALLEESLALGRRNGWLFEPAEKLHRLVFKETGERKKKQEAAEAERQKFELQASAAIADPDKWMKENAKPWDDDPITWARVKNVADSRKREQTADTANIVEEWIFDGKLQTAAGIDAIEGLSERQKFLAKDQLARLNDYRNTEERNKTDPSGITNSNRAFVEILDKIETFDPALADAGDTFLELKQEARRRVNPEDSGYLRELLYSKMRGRAAEIKPGDEIRAFTTQALGVVFDPYDPRTGWMVPTGLAKGHTKGEPDTREKWEWKADPKKQLDAIAARAVVLQKVHKWQKSDPAKANDIEAVRKKIFEVMPEGALKSKAGGLESRLFGRPQAAAITPAARNATLAKDLITTFGGRFEQYSDRDIRDRPGVKSAHASGEAVDFYPATAAEGNMAAGALIAGGKAKRIIYAGRIWERGKGWREYKGEHDHADHVHFEAL